MLQFSSRRYRRKFTLARSRNGISWNRGLILINLLVRLGVAAAVSSTLVRSKEFKSLLFREERTFRQKVYLVLWFALPIMIGVGSEFRRRVSWPAI